MSLSDSNSSKRRVSLGSEVTGAQPRNGEADRLALRSAQTDASHLPDSNPSKRQPEFLPCYCRGEDLVPYCPRHTPLPGEMEVACQEPERSSLVDGQADSNPSYRRVAALFVDPAGVYSGLPDVEVWDEARDARLYDGPWPVVAHPPCARWSLMGMCRGYRDGDDGGCFAAAVESVRRFGGVLEHPAHSLAWKIFGLPYPSSGGWSGSFTDPGLCCEVDQRRYGHDARKPTWLYAVSVIPAALKWGRGNSSIHTVRNMHRDPKSPGDRSAARSRTPIEFRDVLLGMARSAYEVCDALEGVARA